jgi:hypothetical protein
MKMRIRDPKVQMHVHKYPAPYGDYERAATQKAVLKLVHRIARRVVGELLRGTLSRQVPPYPGYRAVGGLFRIPKTKHTDAMALVVLTVPVGQDVELMALNLQCDAYLNLPHYDPPRTPRGDVMSAVVWTKAALQ